MRNIDSDAHVIEGPHSWAFMQGADAAFAPQTFARDGKEFWQVDGTVIRRDDNMGRDTQAASRDLSDVGARLKHMDELGIDIQVIYPTLFLRPYTKNPAVELAVSRGYNRWMADVWRQGGGRLRWVALMPYGTMSALKDEMAFAKDNGACGIYMRGYEHDRRLPDPYFHPLFDLCGTFDLPVCLHSASGSPIMSEFFGGDNFNKFKLAIVGTCHALIAEGVPSMFPRVRWAFIEVSAQWIPYVLNDLTLRMKRLGRPLAEHPFKDNNIFVACQTTDDLPYILKFAGEDNLVVGTDYGHADTATQIEALRFIRENKDIGQSAIGKMLSDNAARLYGL